MRFRFHLRTILVFVFVVSLPLAYMARPIAFKPRIPAPRDTSKDEYHRDRALYYLEKVRHSEMHVKYLEYHSSPGHKLCGGCPTLQQPVSDVIRRAEMDRAEFAALVQEEIRLAGPAWQEPLYSH